MEIARILLEKPKLIMMDEPFAALDSQTREAMRKELIRIWSDLNNENNYKQSVIFVTHSVDEALLLADRIIVMGKHNIENNAKSADLAEIRADISIDLPRPRSLSQHEIYKYRTLVLEALNSSETKTDKDFLYDVGL